MTQEEHYAVVIVDDDPLFREIASGLLTSAAPYLVFEAGTSAELLAILEREKIDCVLLDYDLGSETGFSIKQEMDNRLRSPPPVVLLTGDGRQSTVIKALRMGFDDYVPKANLRANELVTAIRRAVESARAEEAPAAEIAQLRAQSGADPVSGLPGRAKMDEYLARMAAMTPELKSSYALLLVELVNADAIVAQAGLKAADTALRAFGRKLQQLIRTQDICGRYEESRFLIIVDAKSEVQVVRSTCERIAADPAVLDTGSVRLNLTARAGAVMLSALPTPTTDPVAAAGEALLRAERLGVAFELEAAEPPERDSVAETAETAETKPEVVRATERRREPRQRVFKRGQIVIAALNATIDCTIRSVSKHGVGIRTDAPFAVPDTFKLHVVGSGTIRDVRVRWQNGSDLGVEYLD